MPLKSLMSCKRIWLGAAELKPNLVGCYTHGTQVLTEPFFRLAEKEVR